MVIKVDFELKMRILLISLLSISIIVSLIITYYEKHNNKLIIIEEDISNEKNIIVKRDLTFDEEINEIFNF